MARLTENRLHTEAMATIRRLLRAEVDRGNGKAFRLGTRRAEDELDVGHRLFDPKAEAFVRRFEYDAIDTLTVRQAARIQDVTFDGIRRGLNERDVFAAVRKVIGDHEGRVQATARTELNRAANWGRYSGWRESGIVGKKEYVATLDDRVRPGHLAANGNVVPVNEPFTEGDAAGFLMPPIAPNCRCTAVPVTRFSGLSAQATTQEMHGLRAEETLHESRMVAIWRRWPRLLAAELEATGVLV